MEQQGVGRLPQGVELGSLSMAVFQVLSQYTVFPWPVLQAQSKRVGADPQKLTVDDLDRLIPFLAGGVERFTSPDKGEKVRGELSALIARRNR